MQFQKEIDGLRITLFSQSSVLRAGAADLSVLLQDAKSSAPVLDAEVTLRLICEKQNADAHAEWRPPCCSMDGGSSDMTLTATHQEATNKLLYAASPRFPYSGTWNVTVTTLREGKPLSVTDTLRVQKASDPWFAYLPYLLLPGFGVGLFALAQKAKQDRAKIRRV